jgi:hypothetical protein
MSSLRGFLRDTPWHSVFEITDLAKERVFDICSMPNTRVARNLFAEGGGNFLIHKATKALWRLSEDEKSIVPVFEGDSIPLDQFDEEEKDA